LKRGANHAYILARLERQKRFDLLDLIESRQLSAYGVACELGWCRRRRTISAPGDDPRSHRRIFDVKALIG
jgi:hypothetical protein